MLQFVTTYKMLQTLQPLGRYTYAILPDEAFYFEALKSN